MSKPGNWQNDDIPKTGWVFKGRSHNEVVEGGTLNRCMMCLKERPYYLEHLEHPDWDEFADKIWMGDIQIVDHLDVGCDCSGHLQGDLEGTRKRFKEYANERRKELRAARKAAQEAQKQQERERIEGLRERRKHAQNRNGDKLLNKMPGGVLHKQLEKRRVAKERADREARRVRLREVADVVAEFKDTERMSWGPGTVAYPAKQGYYVLKSYNNHHWIDWQPRSRGDYVRLTPTTKNVSERDQWFNAALARAYIDDATVVEALKQITRFEPVTSAQIRARRDRWK